jgi:hypothetical protein
MIVVSERERSGRECDQGVSALTSVICCPADPRCP